MKVELKKGVPERSIFRSGAPCVSVDREPCVSVDQGTSTSTSTSTGVLDKVRTLKYNPATEKICGKCKEVRLKSDFGKHKDQPDGLQTYCKFCKAELGRRRRYKNVRARLRHHMSTRITSQLGKYCPPALTRDLEQYLGYRLVDLGKHLQQVLDKEYPGTKLRDVLNQGWHIDHLYPLSRFNVFDEDGVNWDEFRRCWAISNLKAIPALDNLKKGSKVLESSEQLEGSVQLESPAQLESPVQLEGSYVQLEGSGQGAPHE